MRVLVDALGIRSGGGATLLLDLIYWLPIARPAWEWHFVTYPEHLLDFTLPSVNNDNVFLHSGLSSTSWIKRFLWVNYVMPKLAAKLKASVIFSFVNLSPVYSSIPHVVYVQQLKAVDNQLLAQQPMASRFRLRLLQSFILSGARKSSRLVVQTQRMSDCISDLDQSVKEKISVIPCGARTPNNDQEIAKSLTAHINASASPRICYIANAAQHKNHARLIEAIPLMANLTPTLFLTAESHDVVPVNGEVFSTLGELAEKNNCLDRVVFIGKLNSKEVDYLLKKSDMMVFPSLAESFGLPLVEAMKAHCLIVAADLPYAREVCGDAASFFNPLDANEIAKEVLRLWDSPKTRQRIQKEAQKRTKQFEYLAIAKRIASVLSKAVC